MLSLRSREFFAELFRKRPDDRPNPRQPPDELACDLSKGLGSGFLVVPGHASQLIGDVEHELQRTIVWRRCTTRPANFNVSGIVEQSRSGTTQDLHFTGPREAGQADE